MLKGDFQSQKAEWLVAIKEHEWFMLPEWVRLAHSEGRFWIDGQECHFINGTDEEVVAEGSDWVVLQNDKFTVIPEPEYLDQIGCEPLV